MRPKPFFDTQVCELAASGAIPRADWIFLQDYFEVETDYHISPLTVAEILDRINKDENNRYFRRTQEQIRCLYPHGKRKKFFDFTRYFISRTIFGKEAKRPFMLEKDFAFDLEILLWAGSRSQVTQGVPMPYLMNGSYRLRLEKFSDEIQGIRNIYKQWLGLLKGRKKFSFTPEEWLNDALKTVGMDTPDNRKKFIDALPAAYQFEHWIIDAARNHNYNLDKNISDQIDAQQLYYLCDPTVIFITNDTDHKIRLKGNSQQQRIKTFSEVFDFVRKGKSLFEN
jgi:hypothetical protein